MLVHIVPAVPPIPNGLGDYCYKLWEHWPAPRPEWSCLAPKVSEDSRRAWPEVGLSPFGLSRAGLRDALGEAKASAVVLHYVGYGYHPKGCPVWLPQALGDWKRATGGPLTVMFHELYSKGRPWQTSFWLAPVAKKIVADLAAISDRWVTSCPEYEAGLTAVAGSRPGKGALIPIGANIAPVSEADFGRPWPLAAGRKLKIVIFGLPNTRLWALQAHRNLLARLCEADLVESILLLGKSDGNGKADQETRQIQNQIGHAALWSESGDLTPRRLSETLLSQDIGLVANWPGVLTKSLAYANLCAHGVVPVASLRPGKTASASAPCLRNDDVAPDVCLGQLRDEGAVRTLKEEMRQITRGALGWDSITARWVEVTGTVAPRPHANSL